MTKSTHGICYRLIPIAVGLALWAAPATAQSLPIPILPGPASNNTTASNSTTATSNTTADSNTPTRYIVTAPGGIGVVQALCSLIRLVDASGCSLIESLGDPFNQLFVIATNVVDEIVYDLLDLVGIVHIEVDRLISLLPLSPLISNSTPPPSGLSDSTPVYFYDSTVWNGYAAQPAANVVGANQARNQFNVTGTGTIGIIDTGVDPNHPALFPILVPGYDFTRCNSSNTSSASPCQYSGSELADLNQSTAYLVDGGAAPVRVNGTTIAVLDQSTAYLVDGHSAFGHGTMTAGIVHLVAPTSQIMPLKAFNADGQGYTSDIIRAIYYAACSPGSGCLDPTPKVSALNMSFSTPGQSADMKQALDYAASQSVVIAAAAGNNGTQTVVYPAGYQNDVMAVASTDLKENRSTFSNYGSDVWVAAPGEGIITTYPCPFVSTCGPLGTYAAGWGTSFSTPFVTGTAGLLKNVQANMNEQAASSDIAHAEYIGYGMGHGELDVVRALTAAHSGNSGRN